MKKLSTEEMNRLSVGEFHRSPKLPLTVVLDNVRSQNNIGSIFRTADAFRVEHIALCGICSTPPHREIHKTALGAEESVAWSYHEDTDACVRELKERGYKVFAIEQVDESIKLGMQASRLHGIPCTQASRLQGNDVSGTQASRLHAAGTPAHPVAGETSAHPKVAVVFGNEVEGVQDIVLELCDGALEIPQFGTKHSLNVSCAAAIVMWEMYQTLRSPMEE